MTEDKRKEIHYDMIEFMKRHDLTNVFLVAKSDEELANWIIEPEPVKPLKLFAALRHIVGVMIGRKPDYNSNKSSDN